MDLDSIFRMGRIDKRFASIENQEIRKVLLWIIIIIESIVMVVKS